MQANKTIVAQTNSTTSVHSNKTASSNSSVVAKANVTKTAVVQQNKSIKANTTAPAAKVLLQLGEEGFRKEYPAPSMRGPIPENAHPDHEFSDLVNNDPIKIYGDEDYWRDSPYIPHYFSSTGVPHSRELNAYVQRAGAEYPPPELRGPVP